MPDSERPLVPNKLYDITVKIKELDYTNDTVEVVFASSLSTAYQVIDITFLIDPNDVMTEEIFGGEPIKLSITLLREQDFPGPRVDVELMYLNSNFDLTQKSQMTSETSNDRTYFTVTTIVRRAYQTISTLVNDVFIGTNLNQVISSLASTVGTTVSYDTFGQNTNVIDQVCIPPTTFYKIIKEYNKADDDLFDGYLDQRFGLFSGTPGVFCQHDNKVYIKNLTGKLLKSQAFTVYQLAAGMSEKQAEKIFDESLDGDVFYTYDLIQTEYAGNARFADLASDIHHIVKPKNTIASLITQDLNTIAQNFSLLYSQKNKNLYIDPSARRTRYYNEDTGYDTETTQFDSRFGRSLSTLSSISINLERNLPVLNLIDIGECVKFKPLTLEYADYEGKYILWSSVLTFTKKGPTWASTAELNLIRTNKKN